MTCFEWCTRTHEHSFAPTPTSISAGYRLSLDEKRKIALQTGVEVTDYAHFKRVCKERGWRDQERGEPGLEKKKLIAQWIEAGRPGPNPAGASSIAARERPQESHEERKHRYIREGRIRRG